jgi:hypothetical protein
MGATSYRGINYAFGLACNVDTDTGIRYGVIPVNDVCQAWCDDAEPVYPDPACPACGNTIEDPDEVETCPHCETELGPDDCYAEDALEWYIDSDGYQATQSANDTDIFVVKSPYFTYAQFCSPCAPGACHLRSPLDEPHEANKCYCLGHDWFEDGKAPYPVYRVGTGEIVEPE